MCSPDVFAPVWQRRQPKELAAAKAQDSVASCCQTGFDDQTRHERIFRHAFGSSESPPPFRRVRQSHGGGGEREEARQTSRPTGGQAVQPTRRPFQSGSLINLTKAGAHRWGENIMIILGGIFPILLMIVQEPRKDTRFLDTTLHRAKQEESPLYSLS